jgi:hypothetical protein
MENIDLLIIKYLSKGYKVNEINKLLIAEHSIKISYSSTEKRLNTIRKKYNAKTLFQLAIILKNKRVI